MLPVIQPCPCTLHVARKTLPRTRHAPGSTYEGTQHKWVVIHGRNPTYFSGGAFGLRVFTGVVPLRFQCGVVVRIHSCIMPYGGFSSRFITSRICLHSVWQHLHPYVCPLIATVLTIYRRMSYRLASGLVVYIARSGHPLSIDGGPTERRTPPFT